MKTIYLKAPFYKQIKNRQCKYCVQITPFDIQEGEVEFVSSRGHMIRQVAQVVSYPIESVPWVVLDSLGLVSRQALRAQLASFTKRANIDQVWVLEIAS